VARYARRASQSDNDGDSDSDIEVVGVKPAGKSMQDDDDDDEDDNDSKSVFNEMMRFDFEAALNSKTGFSDSEDNFDIAAILGDDHSGKGPVSRGSSPVPPAPAQKPTNSKTTSYGEAVKLAQDIDALADVFEIGQHASIRPANAPVQPGSFWDGDQYGSALRIFAQILREPDALPFLDPVDDSVSDLDQSYASMIKNPLCFRDIISCLIPENFNNLEFNSGKDGILASEGLSFWNMWCGQDLLQAIDLVFLNALAYNKIAQETSNRSDTNRLRKSLWNGINEIITQRVGNNKELQKQHAPTRRGETSGFVIHKSRTR
jgi:Bromodomain